MIGFRDADNTVAVLFGGRSSEHEISCRSAVFILKNMPEAYRIIPVGISREGDLISLDGTFTAADFAPCTPSDLIDLCAGKPPRFLAKATCARSVLLPTRVSVLRTFPESPVRVLNLEAGVFFPVLHGPNGEDGRLQGVFELAEVPYVGCDIRASVLGIDKAVQKILAREAGVPVARFEQIDAEEWEESPARLVDRVRSSIGFPCFVKPNALGSAVGVNRATSESELVAHINAALRFDEKALVEEPMVGTEVECAFLGTGVNPRITVAGEIAAKDFYSYDAKYIDDDGAAQFIPARLEPQRMQELRSLAARLARVFSLSGLCRIDFWNCHKTGRFVFNEINTLPGLTSISMFPKLWEHEGIQGRVWIEELIVRSKLRQKRMNEKQFGVKALP